MNFTHLIFIPIGTGIVSSAVFLFFLYKTRPKLNISDHICRRERSDDVVYTIKVINKSRFPMYDVKMSLKFLSYYNVGNNTNIKRSHVELSTPELSSIASKVQKKEHSPYAVLVNTEQNLHEMWTMDHSCMEIEIIAKHGLSGFSKVFTKQFKDKEMHLVTGKFAYGDSVDIIKVN